jgi:hypothetical protein
MRASSSCAAWSCSFGLLTMFRGIHLRRPHPIAITAGVGLNCLIATLINKSGLVRVSRQHHSSDPWHLPWAAREVLACQHIFPAPY